MLRIIPILSTTIVIFSLCQCVAVRADDASTKHDIQALYDRISKAYSDMDTDAILSTETDDYTMVDVDGQTRTKGKDAERERLTKVWSVASSIRDMAKVEQVTLRDDGAVVTVRDDYARTQTSPDGSNTAVHSEVGSRRAYCIKTPDGWQVKQEHWLHETVTLTVNGAVNKKVVDGKQVR